MIPKTIYPTFLSLLICFLSPQNSLLASISERNTNAEHAKTVFRHVNLVPMNTKQVLPDQTVIVEGRTIKAIGADDQVKVPQGAVMIDSRGQYLMPGLCDMHAHYLSDYDRDSFFNLFLKNGITTVRLYQSFPNDPVPVWQEEIKQGRLFGPSLYNCGLFFNDPVIPAETLLTAKRDYDFIKLYSFLSAPEFTAIMDLARKEKIHTIGHVPFLVGLDGVIAAGMNEIAHITELDFDLVSYPKEESLRNKLMGLTYSNWVRDVYSAQNRTAYLAQIEPKLDAIVAKVKKAGLIVNTTLVVTHIMTEQLFEKEKFLRRPELAFMLRRFMPEYLAGENAYTLMVASLMKANADLTEGDDGRKFLETYLEINRRLTNKLHRAGVLLVLGTDTPAITVAVVPGCSIHEELRLLTGCGLTNYEALRTATVNAALTAQAMTGRNEFGTLEIGKRADLILMPENPLQNLGAIRKMNGLMLQGRWLSRSDLDALKVEVKANLADLLSEVVRGGGDTAAIEKKYRLIKAETEKRCRIVADPLNDLGQNLLDSGKTAEAVAVFNILVQEFPASWQWLACLADALDKTGDRGLAIASYEKALELDPGNAGLQKSLQDLKQRQNDKKDGK